MPDEKDILGGSEGTAYQEPEKKGAPILDLEDLEGLLGDTPEVWGGAAEKKGAPVLEEQVQLDDPEQSWHEEKRGAPVLDEAPELGEVGSYTQAEQKHEPVLEGSMDDLLGGGGPEVYDEVAEFCKKLQFDDNLKATFMGLDAEKQQQIVEMRAGQLGIPAPMIPNAMRPKAEEALPEAEDVQLEEAPEPEEYVPQFKDEDLERIKEESKKPQRYVPPPVEMTEEKKRENVRIMNELREEREKELAKKGFVQLIILTVVGLIGAVAFGMFFAGAFGLGYKMEEELGWMHYIKDYAPILAIAMGISGLLLALPVPQLKGITKFFYGLSFVLSIFPGVMLLIQKEPGHGALNGILYGLAVLCCGAVVITMSISEAIHMYNKHGNS